MFSKLQENLDSYKLPLALSLIGIVLIIGGLAASNITSQKLKRDSFPKQSLVSKEDIIFVDVSGAVNKPGVYKLSLGSRVEEAITAAGGFMETANGEYISKRLNMAQKLSDGSKIYVPFLTENVDSLANTAIAGANAQSKVNVNTSTQSELEALPGIGPVTASKIISDRPYQSIKELLDKKTISKGVFEKIKDQIAVY